jgi:hypothetical protein
MKKQLILFCMALLAVVPLCLGQASPSKPAKSTANDAAVIDSEKAAWEAYKSKQADAYKKYLAKDYCGVYAEGIKTVDTEVADMAKTDLRDYSFADTRVAHPSADVAVITYKVTTQGTSEGKDMSGTYNSASVWIKHSGKWLTVFHTEAKTQ